MSHFPQLPEACAAPDGTVSLYVEHDGRMVRVDLSVRAARKLANRMVEAAAVAEARALRTAREAEALGQAREGAAARQLEAGRTEREPLRIIQGGAS